jgi:hypothetical protein
MTGDKDGVNSMLTKSKYHPSLNFFLKNREQESVMKTLIGMCLTLIILATVKAAPIPVEPLDLPDVLPMAIPLEIRSITTSPQGDDGQVLRVARYVEEIYWSLHVEVIERGMTEGDADRVSASYRLDGRAIAESVGADYPGPLQFGTWNAWNSLAMTSGGVAFTLDYDGSGFTVDAGKADPAWTSAALAEDVQRLRQLDMHVATVNSRQFGPKDLQELDALRTLFSQEDSPMQEQDLLGRWRCRSIQVSRYGIFRYPYFNCRISSRGDTLFFEKTSGSQRKSGRLYPNDAFSYIFIGASTVNEEPQRRYRRSESRDLRKFNVVGRFVRKGDRVIAVFPEEGNTYEVYELKR